MVADTERRPGVAAPELPCSFAQFFEREYPRLVRALIPVAASLALAEDCVQEAMAIAYERWARVREMESPVGYVYTVAVNVRRRRAQRDGWHAWRSEPSGRVADHADEIVARSDLLRAVSRLPAGQRDALVLVELLGLDSAAAGRALGVAPATVRSRLHRSHETLKHILGGA
jgi:RNA polymerase sigma-70 factor (ECF subfamily)